MDVRTQVLGAASYNGRNVMAEKFDPMLVSTAPISDEAALNAPARSSGTPCIRAMARPRYHLLRRLGRGSGSPRMCRDSCSARLWQTAALR